MQDGQPQIEVFDSKIYRQDPDGYKPVLVSPEDAKKIYMVAEVSKVAWAEKEIKALEAELRLKRGGLDMREMDARELEDYLSSQFN